MRTHLSAELHSSVGAMDRTRRYDGDAPAPAFLSAVLHVATVEEVGGSIDRDGQCDMLSRSPTQVNFE